ncbi:hypothetical protein E2C01_085454 [Portunus trituberculatus]|uniref:Uncharacterized protein n=1 Tax=Portunus trituberculatus TaxID=210409 RepID=A0A5B7J8X5_PORTR|nr:hypothetical protein [Portunus trituberculatus]
MEGKVTRDSNQGLSGPFDPITVTFVVSPLTGLAHPRLPLCTSRIHSPMPAKRGKKWGKKLSGNRSVLGSGQDRGNGRKVSPLYLLLLLLFLFLLGSFPPSCFSSPSSSCQPFSPKLIN